MEYDFIAYMRAAADSCAACGRYGTAHVYRSSLNALVSFMEKGGCRSKG